MAGGSLTFGEWAKLPDFERGERYKDLTDPDKFRVRISMDPGVRRVRCNDCQHYQGFAKCVAFPGGIPNAHLDAVERDPSVECGRGLRYESK